MIQHLNHVPFFRFMLPGIRYHHEKTEGTGYPNGLKGDDIPLFARVIAVVDSYDAMTNVRPYRNQLAQEKAIQELKDFSGTQFDPQLVKTFLEILPEISEGQETKEEVVVARIFTAA
jgi:HD-GYP domain-containing protein (c-di-GMP phosphodiesterase class II)